MRAKDLQGVWYNLPMIDVKILELPETLEKKCPRCGKPSANPKNPKGRCKECLAELRRAKKTPGHYIRAHTKADDALRRQDGKNGTASKKTKGRGTRKEIVDKIQREEKKTGELLSPDRIDNSKGYESSNVRAVPEKLNRGRHKVDEKKLREWREKIKKYEITPEQMYTLIKSKLSASSSDDETERLFKSFGLDLVNLVFSSIEALDYELDSNEERTEGKVGTGDR